MDRRFLIRFYRGEFHRYQAGAYRPISKDDFRAMVARFLECEMERVAEMESRAPGNGSDDDGEGKGMEALPVTSRLVNDVILALGSVCLIESPTKMPAPPATTAPGRARGRR